MHDQRLAKTVVVWVLASAAAVAQNTHSALPGEGFVGEVTGTNVFVRSGPSTNYYEVAKLSAGDRVQVVGENHDWYAIRAPKGCFSLIHKNFVDVDASGKQGVVNGNAVLVRAGSSLRPDLYAKQTKLNRGAVVTIIKPHNDDYLRITPPPRCTVLRAQPLHHEGAQQPPRHLTIPASPRRAHRNAGRW